MDAVGYGELGGKEHVVVAVIVKLFLPFMVREVCDCLGRPMNIAIKTSDKWVRNFNFALSSLCITKF